MSDLVIYAVMDGPLPGGLPKAVALMAVNDIADLSIYGLGSANNGGGTDGEEVSLPAQALAAGEIFTITTDATAFLTYIGTDADLVSGIVAINGDDAIELFENGVVVDTFGEIDVDGSGQAWEYLDGYAIRSSGFAADGAFYTQQWSFSGPNTLDNTTTAPTQLANAFSGVLTPVINEVVVSHTGTDDAEFVEIFGLPGQSLDGLSVIAVRADTNEGDIYFRYDFTSGDVIGADGLFLLGNPTGLSSDYGVTPDADIASNSFVNDDLVIALVETGSLSGDTVTGSETVLDQVALVEDDDDGDAGKNFDFFGETAPQIGPDGSYLPAGAARVMDGVDTDSASDWQIGDFNNENNTPGEMNVPLEDGGEGGSSATVATIMEIQGAGHVSSFVLDDGQTTDEFFDAAEAANVYNVYGDEVQTSGIVTAVDSNGFYLQDPNGDGDTATSDAIFVYTGSTPSVVAGDEVNVTATVAEYFPGSSDDRNLPLTELTSPTVEIVSSGNALPSATILGTSGRVLPNTTIAEDDFGTYDSDLNGIDFWESLEGMRVTVQDAIATSATNQYGEIFTVSNRGDESNSVTGDDVLLLTEEDFNPEKIQIDEDEGILDFDLPEVNAGALLGDVTGVVGYSYGNFEVYPTEDFSGQVIDSSLVEDTTSLGNAPDRLTVASYNVLNLDPNDDDSGDGIVGSGDDDADVADGRFALIASQIVNNLNTPDIIGLQEIQDNNGASNDVGTGSGVVSASETLQLLIDEIIAAGGPTYEFIDNTYITEDASGGFPGGNIRTAFLYNPERVDFVEGTDRPVGSQDSGEAFDGARLPLAADFEFQGETVTVISAHLSSKGGSAPILGTDQPFDEGQEDTSINGSLDERQVQAQAINDFVDAIIADDPDANVVVVGDMNEFQFVSPLEILTGNSHLLEDGSLSDTDDVVVLHNLTDTLDPEEQYTYNFQGNAQVLDHILASDDLAAGAEYEVVHVNSSFAATDERASDHDPVLASFDLSATSYDDVADDYLAPDARGTTGIFDDSGVEIVAYENGRFFTTNAANGTVDVWERNGDTLEIVASIDVGEGGPNSVDVLNGVVAVAVEADVKQDNGFIKLYDATTLAELAVLDAGGALPDMITFSKDGTQLFAALEGEPNDAYDNDPEGGIAIVDLDFANLAASAVTFVDFNAFDALKDQLIAEGVGIYGPNATVSQDLEPEYIAEGANGKLYVTLQENNAVAIVDIATKTVEDVVALGFKDHSIEGNGIDASNDDDAINITTYPIYGMYQPDAIATYEVNGETYFVTANEGDAREYDAYEEEADVEDVVLDPTAFPDAAALQEDIAAGKLNIATYRGDTDGDGDYDELYTYGTRSISIWDAQGNLVWDSGDQLAQFIAEYFPEQFNATNDDPFDVDDRSDNKGGEPEALAITEIDGMQVAIVGLERGNHLIGFDISDPTNPTIIGNIPLVDPADEGSDDYPNSDLGPEGLIVIAADESISGNQEIVVASEVSGTLSVFELGDDEEDDTFTLQLFHVADQEAGGAAISDAPNFSAVLNALRGQDVGADSTLTLSSGDAFIPGLFYDASAAVFGSAGIADIQIQNELGIQAIALGNHEFDFDTAELAALIDGSAVGDFSALTGSTLEGLDFTGTDMPYLSTNLDFSTDSNLAGLEVAGGQAPVGNVVTSSTVIEQDGEVFGIVGATTPTLASISSPGTVGISPAWAGTIPTEAELDALAAEIQAEVDALLAANPSMNKVILLAHMQQISIEQALAARLVDVDIIVAGGSNTRLLDEDDRLRDGDTVQGEYPIVIGNAGGTDTLVVNTDGSYKYVGRLVIEFDADGNILADSYDSAVSGAYATDDQGVADLSAEALVDPEIQAIADAIEAQILATEGNVFGVSDVFLNGNRSGDFSDDDPDGVRTQETNLGNLTADANLAFAQSLDSEVVISLKNGGGIRASIGQTIVPAGGSEAVRIANEEVVDSQGNVVKPEGGISQNDIQTTLAFNNGLVLMTLTVEEIVAILEHGVGSLPNVAGGFPQLSGVKFSFDPDLPSGARILNAVITDEDGNAIATLVQEGVVQNPTDTYRIVTLDFLSSPRFDDDGNFTGAGDGYPFPNTNTDPAVGEVGDADVIARVNKVFTEQEDVQTGDATFADDGTEQDALAEYLLDNFADLATAFSAEDTDPSGDERIQNLDYRADTVLDGPVYDETIDLPDQGGDLDRSGREENLIIRGSDGDDTITLGRGDNLVRTGLGQDRVKFGEGQNKVKGKLEELDGDTIENFDDGDELVLENTLVGRGNMSIRQGSAIIDIDQDGDGAIDATVTIEGDFHDANGNLKDGDFMAVKNGTDTDVSFEKFLPMLQDRAQLSDDMVNGINNQDFLNGDGSTDFRLTMVDLGYARFDSAVGSYAIDIATGEISDVQIHFSNQNTDAGLTSNIIDLGAGQTLGFFILRDGFDFVTALSGSDELGFATKTGGTANAYGDEGLWLTLNGAVVTDEFAFHSFDADLNFDTVQHAVSGVELGGEAITVSFEDRINGGDRDYEDVSFLVESFDIA